LRCIAKKKGGTTTKGNEGKKNKAIPLFKYSEGWGGGRAKKEREANLRKNSGRVVGRELGRERKSKHIQPEIKGKW